MQLLSVFKTNSTLLKSSASLFFLRCIGLLQSLLTIKIYVDYFDGPYFAFLIVLFSYQIVFSFFDLGISNGIINKAIGFLVKDDRKALATLFSGSFAFLLSWILLLNLILVLLLNFTNVGLLLFPGISNSEFVVQMVLLCSLLSTLRCGFALVNSYRLVYDQTYYNGIFDSAALVVSIIGQLLAVHYHIAFAWHIAIIFGIPVLGHVVNLILLIRQRPYLTNNFFNNVKTFFATNLRETITEGSKFFFLQLSSTFAYNSVPIILSFYSKTEEIAVYGILARLFNPISSLITVFLQPQWSYLSQSYLKNEYDKIIKSYRFALGFVVISCISYFVVLYLVREPLSQYFLKGHVLFSTTILLLFGLWIVLSNIGGVFATVLNALNAISYQVLFSFIVIVVFAIEIILFVPRYGLTAVLLLISVNVLLTGIIPSLIKTNRLLHEKHFVI